jgi:hypothetical protein
MLPPHCPHGSFTQVCRHAVVAPHRPHGIFAQARRHAVFAFLIGVLAAAAAPADTPADRDERARMRYRPPVGFFAPWPPQSVEEQQLAVLLDWPTDTDEGNAKRAKQLESWGVPEAQRGFAAVREGALAAFTERWQCLQAARGA